MFVGDVVVMMRIGRSRALMTTAVLEASGVPSGTRWFTRGHGEGCSRCSLFVDRMLRLSQGNQYLIASRAGSTNQ